MNKTEDKIFFVSTIAGYLCLIMLVLFPACTAFLQLSGRGAVSGIPTADSGFINFIFHVFYDSDSGAMMALGRGWLTILVLTASLFWFSVKRSFSSSDLKIMLGAASVCLLGFISSFCGVSSHASAAEMLSYSAVGLLFTVTAGITKESCFNRDFHLTSSFGFERFFKFLNILEISLLTVIVSSWLIYIDSGRNAAMGGSFYQSNMFACFLLINFPLVFARLLLGCFNLEKSDDKRSELISIIYRSFILSASAASIYLTYNRSAWLCAVLLIFLVSALFVILNKENKTKAVLLSLCGVLCWGLFLFLFSRSAVLSGLFCACTLFCFIKIFYSEYGKKITAACTAAAAASVILVFILAPSAQTASEYGSTRLAGAASQQDTSYTSRVQFYKAALKIFLKHPVLGVGPGNFEFYYPEYQDNFLWFSKHSHSLTLDILSECGLPACILFYGTVFCIFAAVVRKSLSDKFNIGVMRAGLAAGALALLLHAQIDVDFHVIMLPMLGAVFLGTAYGIPEVSESSLERRSIIFSCAAAVPIIVLAVQSAVIWPGQYYSTMGKLLSSEGRQKEAAQCWFWAAQSDPKMGEYWRQTGVAVVNGFIEDKDLKILDLCSNRAAALDSHRSSSFGLRSQFLEIKELYPQARENIIKALELDSKNYPVYYASSAKLALRLGNFAEAEDILNKAFAQFDAEFINNSNMFDFRLEVMKKDLAECFLVRFNIAEFRKEKNAAAYLGRALSLDDDLFAYFAENINALADKGLKLKASGETSKADECFKSSEDLCSKLCAAEKSGRTENLKNQIFKKIHLK